MSEISVRQLTKRYDGVVAVDRTDIHVHEGEFLSLLGPSGCGKTTTLRCIAGLERPDGGQISIGADLVADGERGFAEPPNRRRLGMVFQSYALWPHMSVFGNVAYPLRVQRVGRAEIGTRVKDALKLVGLEDYVNRSTSELSGGQQQRVALARALVSRPRVLLLDEPLSNLDASLRSYMRKELRRIHKQMNTTSIYVTHDQLEAVTLSDRVVVMNRGRIEQIGDPRQIFSAPVNRWVAEFVGFDNFISGEVVEEGEGGLSVRPRGWPSVIRCARGHGRHFPPGASVTLAIRSSSFGSAPHEGANQIDVHVVDSTYVGELTEYALEASGSPLTARLPEWSAWSGGSRTQTGGLTRIFVSPDQVVPLEG